MKGRKEEAEVIIRLDQVDQLAHICVSSWPAMARKMLKLYGQPLPKSGRQAHYWTAPLKIVTFRSLGSLKKGATVPFLTPRRRAGGQFGEKQSENDAK